MKPTAERGAGCLCCERGGKHAWCTGCCKGCPNYSDSGCTGCDVCRPKTSGAAILFAQTPDSMLDLEPRG